MFTFHYDDDDGRVTCQGKNCPVLRVTNCHVSRGHTGIGTFNVETMQWKCFVFSKLVITFIPM